IILLREGFEALLVFAALLAFLKRSGNADKQSWIWGGGAAGLALSALIAVVVNVAFAHAGGSSRELLEGVTGLLAAGMLLWMMFWLHSKANIHTWNRYISERSSRALAANSLMSLAAIAFLAVLREGAETVLFYVGIAPAIDTGQLLAGLGIGAAGLLLLAVLMLVVGVRIPIRPFFLVTSVLVFFLAFKFAGMGVHSLQVAGVLTAHTAGYLPTFDFFGVFPTWETSIVQLLILAGTAAGLRLASSHERAVEQHAATPRPVMSS
ncbi:MAG TPA: FTR1 family protein, partial [Chloroflexota bacterium]